MTGTGELERAVMEHLWASGQPQTVRQAHEALVDRGLAYTTVMTVLQRLTRKQLVSQERENRAYRYAPTCARAELVAGLMVEALSQAADRGGRQAALVSFIDRVTTEEAAALRVALATLDS